MATSCIFWCVVLLATIFVIVKIIQRRKYVTVIDAIPGPPLRPIIGNLFECLGAPETVWSKLRQWSKEYYPIYKLRAGPYFAVCIFAPDDVEILLSSSNQITKGKIYIPLHNWLGTGLLTSTGKKWQKRRKILTPAFHFNILTGFLKVFVKETEFLIKQLEEECKKPSIDFIPIISETTLTSVVETAMGIKGDIGSNLPRDYISNVHKLGKIITYRTCRPWLFNSIIYPLTWAFWEERKALKVLHSFSMNVIKRRIKNKALTKEEKQSEESHVVRKRMALLDILLLAMENGDDVDVKGIREEVDTFTFEGHDTTAMSVCYTLMLLACHRNIQERAREEIMDVFGDAKKQPTFQDIQQLPYLEMIIKESLRLYPSVPMITRELSESIITKSGYYIPRGTEVMVHIQDLHYDGRIWPNPTSFDPDRFLPDNTKHRHPFAYLPFSAGPRNCIGQKFAMMEMKIILLSILRNFVLLPVDTPETLIQTTDVINRSKYGVKVKLQQL